MNIELLREKWASLPDCEPGADWVVIGLSADCFAPIHLGVNPNGQRCLLLLLSKDYQPEWDKKIAKANVAIEWDEENSRLVLTLLAKEFEDNFDELILSVFNVLHDIEDEKVFADLYIRTVLKWVAFFADAKRERLSDEVIMGLFGELLVLNNLMDEFDANDVLPGWRGPYDQGKDFELASKDLEVKTRLEDRVSVKIANEHQLDTELDKPLELAVVTVASGGETGLALSDVFHQSTDLALMKGGDVTIIYEALAQKGLTATNIKEYDDIRFVPVNICFHDCLKEGFPRLVGSQLAGGIARVKYELQVKALLPFVVAEVEF